MQNIIKELYYGNIAPCERSYEKDSESRKVFCQYVDLSEKLAKRLNEEDQKLLDKTL